MIIIDFFRCLQDQQEARHFFGRRNEKNLREVKAVRT